MFIIFSSEGGPLQYIGLALFVLQVLPQVLPELHNVTVISIILPASLLLAIAVTIWRSGRGVWSSVVRLRRRVHSTLQDATGLPPQDTDLLLKVLALASFLVFLAILRGVSQFRLTVLLQMMLFIGILYEHLGRRIQWQGRPPSRQSKLQELVQLVRTMPIEEYVHEDRMDQCSISQLEDMLKARSKPLHHNENYNPSDRHAALLRELKQCRNSSDSCCICYEEYNEGDPLRIVPKCCHEFHLECLDQWAYTFANKQKRQQDPTCPLCSCKLR